MTDRKVSDLKAFVPAEDFHVSKQFYVDLGFQELWGDDGICELRIGSFGILLQKFYVAEHAGNFMMSLMVEDADLWWDHIAKAGFKEKYNLAVAKPPELQSWGLRVLFLSEPAGVLWHIAERRKS